MVSYQNKIKRNKSEISITIFIENMASKVFKIVLSIKAINFIINLNNNLFIGPEHFSFSH